AAFARDAVDVGVDVEIDNLSFVGSENMLKLLTEGQDDAERYTRQLINSQVVPSYEDTSIPAVQEYRDLMARYDPQVPADLVQEEYAPFAHSFGSLEGFLNAKLMGEILRRLGPNPDRAGLEEAVFSIEDFDLGISERVSFGPDRRQGLQSVYPTVVEEGRFVPLDDWGARFG
ncbi:MAG: ABC transporter substrate-binding protein, partial [Holophagales bacterium]|nr:ABC transporter substrate-binding protein [Holophagales bacterium]